MRFGTCISCLLLVAADLAQAQGGSAVITLVMPPPGGEGFSMLQSGGMFANGATSTYYNPALLADLERNTGSQLHYTESSQQLLPVLHLQDLFQEYRGVAAVFPDREGGTDLGVGFFRNHVSFGKNQQTDQEGRVLAEFDSYETIYGAGIGVRLGLPISLGGGVKYIDSRLAQGITTTGSTLDGVSRSWAFDLGALANPRFTPPVSLGWPYFELTPSAAVALKNLGPDVFYNEVNQSDPIPTSLVYGIGLSANLMDMAEIELACSADREVHHRTSWSDESVFTTGMSLGLLGMRYSLGWLQDDPGRRHEKHMGRAIDLNMLQVFRAWRRLTTGDFRSPPEVLEAGYPFGWTKVMGFPFRANPRLIVGIREIESRRDGIRNGQNAFFMALSL